MSFAQPTTPSPPSPVEAILATLWSSTTELYGVLDAARDEQIRERLARSGEEYRSLYEGPEGESLAPYAPYLVRLRPGGAFLEELIREGWGRSWGVLLSARADFAEVRRHLRRFLLVRHEDGRELYFRFYDPRVLRVFLPACDEDELREFFGPVEAYWMEEEGTTAGLLRCSLASDGLAVGRPLGGG